MKYRYKAAIVLLSLLSLNTGCIDMLDEKPKSIIYESSITSARELELSLVGAYRGFTQSNDGQTFWKKLAPVDGWGSMGTDIWEMTPDRTGEDVKFGRYQFTQDNNSVKTFWSQYYMIINRLNYILDIAEQIDIKPEQKAAIIAEAKFMRGFSYFELAKYFGGVPLRLKHSVDVASASHLKKSTEAEVYAQAIADMEEAAANLPEKSIYGRANKWAAKGLLSKMYLFCGGYLYKYADKEYFRKSLALSNEIIQSGLYPLNPTDVGNPGAFKQYGYQFTSSGDNTLESLFELQFETGELGGGWGYRSVNGGQNFDVSDYGKYFYYWGGHRVSSDFALSFDDSDVRFQWSIATFELKRGQRKANPSNWWFPSKFRVEDKASGWENPINAKVLRMAEVYLLYAEAYNELYDAPASAASAADGFNMTAFDAINKVRERAQAPLMDDAYLNAVSPFIMDDMHAMNYGMSTESFIKTHPSYTGRHVYYQGADAKERFRDAILMERGWELCFEAHRWFDLKRMGRTRELVKKSHLIKGVYLNDFKDPQDKSAFKINQLPKVQNFTPYVTAGCVDQDNIFYLPIPKHELDYNNMMDESDQNPGY